MNSSVACAHASGFVCCLAPGGSILVQGEGSYGLPPSLLWVCSQALHGYGRLAPESFVVTAIRRRTPELSTTRQSSVGMPLGSAAGSIRHLPRYFSSRLLAASGCCGNSGSFGNPGGASDRVMYSYPRTFPFARLKAERSDPARCGADGENLTLCLMAMECGIR